RCQRPGPPPGAARPRGVLSEQQCLAARSALGVLRRLAGLLEPVLLALLDPRVTGEEAGLLERGPVVGVELAEGPGDREAQRAGLAGDAATAEVRDHVEGVDPLGHGQRLADDLLVHLVREVRL